MSNNLIEKHKMKINIIITIILFFCIVSSFYVRVEKPDISNVLYTISSNEFKSLKFVNCHIEENTHDDNYVIVPDNNDPMVFLPVQSGTINCIKICFASKLSQDTSIQLFYDSDKTGLSEQKSILLKAERGKDYVILQLPENSYSALRLDIDGKYSIESIEIGYDESYPIYNNFYILNYYSIFLTILIIILLIIFNKRLGYFEFVKNTILNLVNKIKKIKLIIWLSAKLYNKNDCILNKSNPKKTANVFTAVAMVFGMLMIFITPPMQTPDHISHFANVCRISSGDFFVDVDENGNYGSLLYPEEISFIYSNHEKYSFRKNANYSYSEQMTYYRQTGFYSGEKELFTQGGTTINPMAYLSSVWGVFIAKAIFGTSDALCGVTNPYYLLIWARFSSLLFYVIVVRIALIKTPIMRNTMFLLALMPETFFQCCSVSYDVELICGGFLLFAYGTKLIMAEDNYKVTVKDIIAICFSCACLFAAKLIYIIFALILFAISYKKFGSIKRYIASISLVALMGVIFYLLPTMITNHIIGDFALPAKPLVEEQRSYLITHPDIIPTIMINTFKASRSWYLASFVGQLGFQYVPLAPYVGIYLIALFATTVVELCSVRGLTKLPRFLCFISSLIVVNGIILALYISFNPQVTGGINAQTAGGVVGRYFIPVFLFCFIWLANPILTKFKYANKVYECLEYTSKFVGVTFCLLTCAMVFTAYWQ